MAAAAVTARLAFDALTRDGAATLIALEKSSGLRRYPKRGVRASTGGAGRAAFSPGLPKDFPQTARARRVAGVARAAADGARDGEPDVAGSVRRGLASAGDFGIMGERPTHPELLTGWRWISREWLGREEILPVAVTSATYRQSSAATAGAREGPGQQFRRAARGSDGWRDARDSAGRRPAGRKTGPRCFNRLI